MLPKNAFQFGQYKTMQNRSKMFKNNRKRFAVKFCTESCVFLANLKVDRFVFLYAPVLYQ